MLMIAFIPVSVHADRKTNRIAKKLEKCIKTAEKELKKCDDAIARCLLARDRDHPRVYQICLKMNDTCTIANHESKKCAKIVNELDRHTRKHQKK